MAGRQGLNCTFSYTDGTTAYTYQVRAGSIGYGTDMIYAEDQGRTQRSYYPHRTANQQFSIQVLLKNWDERQDFMSWVTRYAQFALDPNLVRTVFPFLQVAVPARNFFQQGMPLTGYEWGAHAGMMAFSPVFVFEAAQSPGQSANALVTSSVINAAGAYAADPAIQYFYPFGTQLEASQVPVDYGQVLPDPGTVSGLPSADLTNVPGSGTVVGVSSAGALAGAGGGVVTGTTAAAYPPPGFTQVAGADLGSLGAILAGS